MQRPAERRRRFAPVVTALIAATILIVPAATAADICVDLPRLSGVVAGVADGDTIDVRLESGLLRVRLGERSVDAELIAGGNAWVYRRYASEASLLPG
jgi:endonuclease YncB( thermonuclease family)